MPPTLRIATWNVEYGRGEEKNARRRALIEEKDADVWILTETSDALDLSGTHPHSGVAREQPGDRGGRWTTIWSRLPIRRTLTLADPQRCVGVIIASPLGEVVVIGVVLPWNGDSGPDPSRLTRGWEEFHRVVPHYGTEWLTVRRDHPDTTVVVAGDLNQDLGGRHFYGSPACRELLLEQLGAAGLTVLTTTDRLSPGALAHPPIDHLCAGPPRGHQLTSDVDGWEGSIAGARLSDHSGVIADITVMPGTTEENPRGNAVELS